MFQSPRKASILILLWVTLPSCAENEPSHSVSSPTDSFDSKVIYGSDDRRDFHQANPVEQNWARSTVALVRSQRITSSSGERYTLGLSDYLPSLDGSFCEREPYREQKTLAYCSGFLVSPQHIVTAGHCIANIQDCRDTRFVFDYSVKQPGIFPRTLHQEQVYSCGRVVSRELESSGVDYAVIELDRPVSGSRTPLKLRTQGNLTVGTPLTVIGHPSGLPTKIAGGASVRDIRKEYFVANLDTYGGNSGSAVLHASIGEVEGILVRGEVDFVQQGSCFVSRSCSNSGCRGEDVTLISEVLSKIPAPSPPGSQRVVYRKNPKAKIPDQNEKGIVSRLLADQAPNGREVRIKLDIRHPYRGDLKIQIEAPDGTRLTLKRKNIHDHKDHVVGTYGKDLLSADDLQKLSEVTQPGNWKLHVSDHFKRDRGVLKRWVLIFRPH